MKNSPNKNAENLRKMSKVPAFHLSSYMKIHFVPASGETSPIKWTCGCLVVGTLWGSQILDIMGPKFTLAATYSHLQPLTATCKLP
jgi:hypothetical protein